MTIREAFLEFRRETAQSEVAAALLVLAEVLDGAVQEMAASKTAEAVQAIADALGNDLNVGLFAAKNDGPRQSFDVCLGSDQYTEPVKIETRTARPTR